jgi:hypothetical protein
MADLDSAPLFGYVSRHLFVRPGLAYLDSLRCFVVHSHPICASLDRLTCIPLVRCPPGLAPTAVSSPGPGGAVDGGASLASASLMGGSASVATVTVEGLVSSGGAEVVIHCVVLPPTSFVTICRC